MGSIGFIKVNTIGFGSGVESRTREVNIISFGSSVEVKGVGLFTSNTN